ncbi:MAG: ABC transporter ATP-binding protein [Lactobacillaceae bacterium]|jgi:ABC-2 type transport system ATP-binding protein|nr:ABC transporter ATP-binding protein [Lactobacillaceae bacterium]
MSATIEIKNLIKDFGTIKALDGISFNTRKGDIIALLGPNGAGKSTLMNIITGYLSATAGSVVVLGKDIKQDPIFVRENIGFLSEGAPLYPDLTVRTFLTYMAELRGFKGIEKKREVDNAADVANVKNILNQKIETLSKGYSRRVGFAQSVIGNPPILLLDEPTDGLDPNQKEHMRNLISKMGKDKTIIISTHLLEEAETICNRIILINEGQIMTDGTLEEVLKKTKSKTLADTFKKLTNSKEKK